MFRGIVGHARLATGRSLPTFVQQEFAAYLKCGPLEHGFLRVRCLATECLQIFPRILVSR